MNLIESLNKLLDDCNKLILVKLDSTEVEVMELRRLRDEIAYVLQKLIYLNVYQDTAEYKAAIENIQEAHEAMRAAMQDPGEVIETIKKMALVTDWVKKVAYQFEVEACTEGWTHAERPSPIEHPQQIDWGSEAEAPAPKKPQIEAKKAIKRYVNLWFTHKYSHETPIERKHSLIKGKAVYLRVQIAPLDKRTILKGAQPFISQDKIEEAFPETKGKTVPIEITLFSNDFKIDPHECTRKTNLVRGQTTDILYFPVTPLKEGTARLRVCVFYQNHLLQSLNVSAIIALHEDIVSEPQCAHVEMTFSADFTRVEELPARGLWLGINQSQDGSHTLNIKGNDVELSRRLQGGKIEGALQRAREVLDEVSFVKGSSPKKYRFREDHYPTALNEDGWIKRFKEDLTKLAKAGSVLYDAVFGTGAVLTAEERPTVQPLVDQMEKDLRNEQIIQIARLKDMADIWPWSLMYDLVIAEQDTDVCLAFRGEDGRPLPYAECVKRCKHRDPQTLRNNNRIVCPYGFWGFKHIIEQPTQPGRKQAFTDLVLEIKIGQEPVFEMPIAEEFSTSDADHIANMKKLGFKPLTSIEKIIAAFDPYTHPPQPHAMYFFCHGAYDSGKQPMLLVGKNDPLTPRELYALKFNWDSSHGIVFINGCYTVDMSPNDLSTIMAPFVMANAAGIVGTEISVTTCFASEFGQKFFEYFLPKKESGPSVGQIIKDLRLYFLMKYNPLGLVYTPYCSADLRMVR